MAHLLIGDADHSPAIGREPSVAPSIILYLVRMDRTIYLDDSLLLEQEVVYYISPDDNLPTRGDSERMEDCPGKALCLGLVYSLVG